MLITTHNFDHVLCKLEISRFETKISPWRNTHDKPEVDMDQVAFIINQNIPVVSILALKNVWHNGIASLTSNEVVSRLLKTIHLFISELLFKIAVEIVLRHFTYLVSAHSALNAFDDTTDVFIRTTAVRNRVVRLQIDIQAAVGEYRLAQWNDL